MKSCLNTNFSDKNIEVEIALKYLWPDWLENKIMFQRIFSSIDDAYRRQQAVWRSWKLEAQLRHSVLCEILANLRNLSEALPKVDELAALRPKLSSGWDSLDHTSF